MGVSGAEAGKVFRPDRTLGNDRRGPFDEWAVVHTQPDVGQHPGPTAIAVAERVNLHRSVVDENGLFEDIGHVLLPASNVVAQLGQVFTDVCRITSQRQRLVANLARPRPDISEHLTVEPEHPAEVEGGDLAGRRGEEIPKDSPPDILRLGDGELGSGTNVTLSQAVEIGERRFAVGGHCSISPQHLAAGRLQFALCAFDHCFELVSR